MNDKKHQNHFISKTATISNVFILMSMYMTSI